MRRQPHLRELMDGPDCDPDALRRTYAGFGILNPVVSGWGATYRRLLRPLLSASVPRTLLDVGSGGGDLARRLARLARRDGLLLEVTGVDPDARAHAYASAHPAPGVRFVRATAAQLDERFDFVVSNHVLHHLSDVPGFLVETSRLARVMTVHSDISRSRFASVAFGAATAPFFPGPACGGSFIRPDGLVSIRRSFTPAELRELAGPDWRVIALNPTRLLAVSTGRG
ncbi:2-polyprenyl-3-methyl-5-hydroxy-6-metoxy-1,4-benzoquinol methylase [Homoserinimonas aerilata]|uniref:2-polyprenyl-3-methyl-5-hydroxy-6-metoxy-1, 4-benzoquinol methylase n=1 Tax=Homoserinimonas aerilata TaxID=1162970 RepID=A0A542YKW3_9MICO|nr:methyltransferase domain-containing protein [Homoserinimonas aerilata]TQL48725.1 2-polyprenyl-3-methyl-5-hydroxy-6-metoxy-1,4-benzoquinol methylase [Homoserinimonas aerilata]